MSSLGGGTLNSGGMTQVMRAAVCRLFGFGLSLCLFALSGFPGFADDRVLTLYGGDKHAPIVCNPDPDAPGSLSEKATEMFRRAGYRVRVECTAWSRAQAVVKADPNGIILNMARTPERENEYLWLLKTGEVDYGIATTRTDLTSLADALRVGPVVAVRGTPRVTELQSIGPDTNIVQVNDPGQAARMLVSGRVVAWYDTDTRMRREWAEMAPSIRPFFVSIRRVSGYLAAGTLLSGADRIQSELEKAAASMREDGTWQAIDLRYAVPSR